LLGVGATEGGLWSIRFLLRLRPSGRHHGLGRSSTVNHFTFGPRRRHHHPVPSPLNLSTSYQYFISNGDHDTSPVCFISGFPFRAAKAVTTPTSNRFAIFNHPGRPLIPAEKSLPIQVNRSTKRHPGSKQLARWALALASLLNPSTLVSAPISAVTSYFRRTSHLPF